jgi:GNAT superfamily N-acetyltransferase
MADMKIALRDAELKDIEVLARLMTELGYPTSTVEMGQRFVEISADNKFKTIICEYEGVVAGMAGGYRSLFYEKNGSYVRITALVTSKAFRNKGIGKALITAFENWASENGANALILNCGNREERIAAHKFYLEVGFTPKSTGYAKTLHQK